MNCFTIKSGKEFIANSPRIIKNSYYCTKVNTVDYEDEAKHYTTESKAKNWLKNTTKRYASLFVVKTSVFKTYKSPNYIFREAKRHLAATKLVLDWLQDAHVVEIDVEVPNYNKTTIIEWRKDYRDNELSHASKMKLQYSKPNTYCKSCGVRLKNIPFYLIDNYAGRICVPCLYLRLDNIKAAYEGMDEDHRQEITNEHILGGL